MADADYHAPSDSKLEFNSTWDIDQLVTVTPITTSIAANATATVYTFSDINSPPVFEIMAQSGSQWYQPGQNGVMTGQQINIQAWISGTSIVVHTNQSANLRVYVWEDRINY